MDAGRPLGPRTSITGKVPPSDAGFPPMPSWFGGNLDFGNIADGLRAHGFAEADVEKVMSGNWLRFFEESFGPAV